MDEKIIKSEILKLYTLFMETNKIENQMDRTEFQNKVLNSLGKIYKEVSQTEDLKNEINLQMGVIKMLQKQIELLKKKQS